MAEAPPRPGIAISGAAGTGKTSLARALADRLELPYIEEGMRRRLENGLDVHAMSLDQRRDLAEALLEEMVADVTAARRDAGGFVCDRCTLDLAAFWLYYGFGFDRARTDAVIGRARAAMSAFSMVTLVPLGVFELEDDGVRTPNPWIQFHFDAVLRRVLDWSSAPVRELPATPMSVEARADLVLSWSEV